MFNISLTKRYIPAVILVSAFIVITNIINSNSILKNKEYGKIINTSGKQRMLSQKLVILATKYLSKKNEKTKRELKETLKDVSVTHADFTFVALDKKRNPMKIRNVLRDELSEHINKLLDTK